MARLPCASTAMRVAVYVPGKVLTLPVGATLRMRLLPLSSTKRLPARSKARSSGALKRAVAS